jgi:hypothetical protein
MPETPLPEFMMSTDDVDTESLLLPWRWLVPPSVTPLFLSVFGDWVFGAPDGSIWALSVLEGQFWRIATNSAEYNRLKSSFEWLDENFVAGWQQIAHRHGLVPTQNQCIGWKVHPILGGPFEPANLQLFDTLAYQHLMGQLHRQLQRPQ